MEPISEVDSLNSKDIYDIRSYINSALAHTARHHLGGGLVYSQPCRETRFKETQAKKFSQSCYILASSPGLLRPDFILLLFNFSMAVK